MYTVSVLDAAIDDLKKLDRPVAWRILQRIEWLAENLDNANREMLTGQFAGLSNSALATTVSFMKLSKQNNS